MAETYTITLSIKIVKDSNKEVFADEAQYYNNLNVAKMAKVASEYYDLLSNLLKIK